MGYYNWNDTFGYQADVTMVVGARGLGKTYGLREQFLRDAEKGWRFVQAVRYKAEVAPICADYFGKVLERNDKYRNGYDFKYEGGKVFWRRKGEGSKAPFECIGYIVPLTSLQLTKQTTYHRVKRIAMDEAILDKRDRYHGYLASEYTLLADLVDSCTRQNPNDGETDPVYLYLLANALDLVNPYFVRYGIKDVPPEGYSWHDGKHMLLHYVKDADYGTAKQTDTLAGRMLAGTKEGALAAFNDFSQSDLSAIKKKPKHANWEFGINLNGKVYGIWYDSAEGFYHISYKHLESPIFTLTLADGSPDYISIRRRKRELETFIDLGAYGMFRYDSPEIQQDFLRGLALYGFR